MYIKIPNAWLEMSVTSNMCPPKPKLMDMFIETLQRLEEIQIWEDPEKFNPNSGNNWYVAPYVRTSNICKCDGYGQQAEYMRNGMDSDATRQRTTHFKRNR